ncbi:4'-phosphopantetheinyl transferase family protein [Shouchella miscanthi]|uniref:4'-phosphopantetheinyl transferase family protein n=1 Tax=Shouchella miscanthi TaxID=2598861 RepID=UPI0011A7224F|nr:4'-phosphopantetheinyl transferase superfamily protein [Shouchella miscanthi]
MSTNVYAFEISKPFSESQKELFLHQIPLDRQERVRSYVREEDAIRSLCGSLLIKYILWKELQITKFNLNYNKYGKPSIAEFPNFHYNLSHSHNWIVCATNNKEVGIDIEKIKEIDLGIAERFFTSAEFDDIKKMPTLNDKLTRFYEFWTMKEAFIKNLGKGLSVPLNSFCIRQENNLYVTNDKSSKLYYFKQPLIDTGYKLAVCTQQEILDINIKYIDIKDFNILL